MIQAVSEYREVYKQEVGNEQELRWFIAHARRKLELAKDLGIEAELLIGTIPYQPRNIEELRQIWQEISQKTAPYFKEGKKVFCRIIYKTP